MSCDSCKYVPGELCGGGNYYCDKFGCQNLSNKIPQSLEAIKETLKMDGEITRDSTPIKRSRFQNLADKYGYESAKRIECGDEREPGTGLTLGSYKYKSKKK